MSHGKIVFLLPGEIYFGQDAVSVKTVLGSCVAVVMWHPIKRIGGMCHFVLPDMPLDIPVGLQGKYSEGAIGRLFDEAARAATKPADYRVGLYGGGQRLADAENRLSVGLKNVHAALDALKKRGIEISEQRTGGVLYRNIVFHLQSGCVELRENPFTQALAQGI
jgi:chemotaxis protein CheD